MIYRAAFCLMVRSGFVSLLISENQEGLYLKRKPVLELMRGFWWLRHHAALWNAVFLTGNTSTAILRSATLCLSCSCCRAANPTATRILRVYVGTAGAINANTPEFVTPCTHVGAEGGVCVWGGGVRPHRPLHRPHFRTRLYLISRFVTFPRRPALLIPSYLSSFFLLSRISLYQEG